MLCLDSRTPCHPDDVTLRALFAKTTGLMFVAGVIGGCLYNFRGLAKHSASGDYHGNYDLSYFLRPLAGGMSLRWRLAPWHHPSYAWDREPKRALALALATVATALMLGCAARLLLSVLGLRAAIKLPHLAKLPLTEPPRWPRVTLLIPACNEAATIEAPLHSKLGQDYPDLELVVVDDRSADATGAIIDRIAAGDARVRALHLHHLPEDWLGKVHALQQGVALATGDWLLVSDADVHLAPDTIRRAVAYAEHRGLDFLTAMPEFTPVSLVVDTQLADLARSLLPILQPGWLERPGSKLAVGGGAFMLARRAAYDRTPGWQALRLEVLDDMAFGQMMKASGARCGIVNGKGLVRLAFYTSVADAALGAEKAFASAGRCSVARLVSFVAVLVFVNLAPYVALALPSPSWLRPAGALAATLDVASSIGMLLALGGRVVPAVLAPLGTLVMAGLLLRSAWLAFRRGGIMWRGTLYPTERLRGGLRYRFPWG